MEGDLLGQGLPQVSLPQADLPKVILEQVSLPRANYKDLQFIQAGIDPNENAKNQLAKQQADQQQKLEDNNNVNPVDMVFDRLAHTEGFGDDVTNVVTGNLGVTGAARLAVGADENVPDEEVAKQYLDKLNNQWGMRNGYAEAPEPIKAMLLDATYNIGESSMNMPKLTKALAEGNYKQASLELLDTANVDGMSLKGIAKRRAESYNIANPDDPIATVEQLRDGTIKYLDGNGYVITSYRPQGGRHPKSKAGRIEL